MTGTITKVLHNKGYAFIRGEDKLSRFAHRRAFADTLEFDLLEEDEPRRVEFDPIHDPAGGDNGLRASNVKVLPRD